MIEKLKKPIAEHKMALEECMNAKKSWKDDISSSV
jgi:hypothetical protein